MLFRYLVSPTRFLGDKSGRLVGVELVHMAMAEPDESGRPRPVPIPGSEHLMEVDTCIVAVGYRPELLVPTSAGLTTNLWGGLVIDEQTGATNRRGVFAGGDCVTGPKTVVHAVAAGRRAAESIARYLETDAGVSRRAASNRVRAQPATP